MYGRIPSFVGALIKWYRENKRDLPWRDCGDPYKVWVSEIILQQTRVIQGLPYYNKFVAHFPDVKKLAGAREELILKLWQGLGYYTRARNMLIAAKQVCTEFGGRIPESYSELRKLKGIGPYSAAAISSICFNEQRAVLDGNVMRVLSRIFAIDFPVDKTEGRNALQKIADRIIPAKNPGEYNQAIMELGAMVCLPKAPDCKKCPVFEDCLSGSTGDWELFPVKGKLKVKKKRYFDFLVINNREGIYIQKRKEKDIWRNLWQFPNIEGDCGANIPGLRKKILVDYRLKLEKPIWENEYKVHQLTHQTLFFRFWEIYTKKPLKSEVIRWVSHGALKKFPFPVPIAMYLKKITNFEKKV